MVASLVCSLIESDHVKLHSGFVRPFPGYFGVGRAEENRCAGFGDNKTNQLPEVCLPLSQKDAEFGHWQEWLGRVGHCYHHATAEPIEGFT